MCYLRIAIICFLLLVLTVTTVILHFSDVGFQVSPFRPVLQISEFRLLESHDRFQISISDCTCLTSTSWLSDFSLKRQHDIVIFQIHNTQ
jgi:hypothetical protein